MEILYSAIEEKQAELNNSLLLIKQHQEQIRKEFEQNEYQNEQALILLDELQQKELSIKEEFNTLSNLSVHNGEFEDIRSIAKMAHECITDDNCEISLDEAEKNLNELANNSEDICDKTIIEYRRLKKSPPENLSQEELLNIYLIYEQKIAKERVKSSLLTIMAEQILNIYKKYKGTPTTLTPSL